MGAKLTAAKGHFKRQWKPLERTCISARGHISLGIGTGTGTPLHFMAEIKILLLLLLLVSVPYPRPVISAGLGDQLNDASIVVGYS